MQRSARIANAVSLGFMYVPTEIQHVYTIRSESSAEGCGGFIADVERHGERIENTKAT